MEHRLGRRVATCDPVHLLSPSGDVTEATLTNLSLSGAFVRTAVPAPDLSTLHVVMSCEIGSRRREAILMAHVVRRCAGGLGIEWSILAPPLVQARLQELGRKPRGSDGD